MINTIKIKKRIIMLFIKLLKILRREPRFGLSYGICIIYIRVIRFLKCVRNQSLGAYFYIVMKSKTHH